MKNLKILFITGIATLIVSGCGTSVAPIISAPIENIDTQPLKITDLNEDQLKNWPAMDLVTDTVPGMSVNKAYSEILNNRKKGVKVIVAVIDSGVDIEHEDLKDVIWTNKDEIPNNGIDDDKNGYIDDIHGWNFLGDIVVENLEYTRIVKTLGKKYEGKTEASISATDLEEFKWFKKAEAEYKKEYQKALTNKTRFEQMLGQLKPAHEAITKKLGKEDYSTQDLSAIENPTETEKQQIAMLSQMLLYGDSIPGVIKELQGGLDYFGGKLETHLNLNKDFRAVLGDNPDDFSDNKYGNNDVDGPTEDEEDVMHGTHVAGIIAAKRNNGIGIDGVAGNVEIMVIRAVPDGDEYDKDIALAIRYAVDNGAKIINTSFGKYYSPHPEWVWDAIKYAEKHDVLIVNAAGNDGVNLDTVQVYPNDQILNGDEISDTFLTVGALNYKYGSEMVAPFSNYGKTSVDVFSPGMKIWSTIQKDKYRFLQGTSMASPEVAGIAAVLRSYFPKLSAAKVKQIIMKSGLAPKTQVILGGDSGNKDSFQNISTSGKIANLYNALILASKTK